MILLVVLPEVLNYFLIEKTLFLTSFILKITLL